METENLFYFINSEKRVYWLFILGAIFIAAIFLYFNPKQKRIIFNKKLWLHPSAILDYKYFIFISIAKLLFIAPLILSIDSISRWLYFLLLDNFGINRIYGFSQISIILLFSATLFIVNDLTRYLLHRLMHKNKFLWHIHQTHHSAKVLNPLTFYRIHPIEAFLFGLRYSLVYGIIIGLFIYFFGANVEILEIMGISAISFIFNISFNNLRHSHIKLGYPKALEYIFISPKQHQIHHTTKNNNKNYGSILAIWDYMFRSLKLSKSVMIMRFGLNKTNRKFNNIINLLIINKK